MLICMCHTFSRKNPNQHGWTPLVWDICDLTQHLKLIDAQIYLHGKALPTASICTAEGLLILMVCQNVTLQIEATSELLIASFSGAWQLPLLPRVDTQLMLVQKPSIVKQLFALSTRHLDWEQKPAICDSTAHNKRGMQCTNTHPSITSIPLCSFLCFRYSVHVFPWKGHSSFSQGYPAAETGFFPPPD